LDAFTIGRFLGAALVVLLAPGSALLAWLPDAPSGGTPRRGLLSKIADAVALSIAIPALLALGLFLARVRLSGWMVVGMYGVCLLFGLAGAIKRGMLCGWRSHPGRWAGGLLALLFLSALVAWRLYQARALALPNWVDSVQHFLIVRAILEYGGVPPDLTPYLPVPLNYHYGYHLIAALFTFLSGIPAAQAGLWFGQVLNALVAISVYRGAEAFAGHSPEESPGSQQAGLSARQLAPAAPWIVPTFAALLVGFDFQMPAYYLTWGRYTMLAGLLLLGPTLVAAMEVRDQPQRRSAWVRLVLLIAGQGVTHYFVLLLTGFSLLAIGLPIAVRGLRDRGDRGRACRLALARLVVLTGLGIVLASPWILGLWQEGSQVARLSMVSPLNQSEAAQKSMAEYQKYLIYLIGPRRNYILMGLASVGALAALPRSRLRPLVGWGVFVALLSLPWGLRLGPFRPDHFSIVLFFPAAILLAELASAGGVVLGKLARPWVGLIALGLASLFLIIWGLRDTRNMVNADTVLAFPADVSALEWVKEHTPPEARFYINGSAWQGNVYRGVDGGSWLLPYTGRFSLVPPISYSWGAADYVEQVNDWAKRSTSMEGCNPDFWNLVREANLTHVYLRKGKGSLQPEMLATCQRLRQVYQQDGVAIYEILLPR
jgi:hypothetical protein